MTDDLTALSFDAVADRFGAAMHRASCWKTTYYGAAYSTRIKEAIAEVRAACDEAEKHPEIAP